MNRKYNNPYLRTNDVIGCVMCFFYSGGTALPYWLNVMCLVIDWKYFQFAVQICQIVQNKVEIFCQILQSKIVKWSLKIAIEPVEKARTKYDVRELQLSIN